MTDANGTASAADSPGSGAGALAVNDIGEVLFETQQPVPIERFADDRVAGALLVVDPATNRTSGAFLVREALSS